MLGFCFPFAGLKVSALISFFTSLWMCLLKCVTSLLLQQHSVCSHGNHCDVISKRISVPRQQCKLRVTGLRRGGDSETRLVWFTKSQQRIGKQRSGFLFWKTSDLFYQCVIQCVTAVANHDHICSCSQSHSDPNSSKPFLCQAFFSYHRDNKMLNADLINQSKLIQSRLAYSVYVAMMGRIQ